MAEITAKLVNELRAKSGQAMMECKRALQEVGGDIEKAVEYFRKKGVKTSVAERATTEGQVVAAVSADHKTAAAVEVVCNTDFTAKSDLVHKLATDAAQKLLAHPSATGLSDDPQLKTELTHASQQTGENVQFGRTIALTGESVGSYLYTTAGKGKIAVLMAAKGQAGEDVFRSLGMHIAAARPVALSREQVPAELVAKEKEIAVEQAKATGKPQAIAEKIAEGKLNSFYAERVLLDQEFINPEMFKGTVAAMLKAKNVTLEKYVRVEVGQA